MNKKSILFMENKRKKELQRLTAFSDDKIDFSDIPPLDFDALGKPVVGKFYRPSRVVIFDDSYKA